MPRRNFHPCEFAPLAIALLPRGYTAPCLFGWGFEFAVQGGYGWGTGHWSDVTFLGSAAGGQLTSLGSDSSRQLVGGSANLVWSPIYAKLAWGAHKVLHFDVYATLGGHGFLGQRLEADGGLRAIVGPSVGIGLKFFQALVIGS